MTEPMSKNMEWALRGIQGQLEKEAGYAASLAQAWDEAAEYAESHYLIGGDNADDLKSANPYRKDVTD